VTSNRVVALGALIALAACGTPDNYVVLLDNADGHASTLTLSNPSGSSTLAAPGQAVGGRSGKRAPKPLELDGNHLAATFGQAIAAAPAPPLVFVLNFQFDSTDLTPDSRRKLPEILDIIRRRPAPDVAIVGHTDRSGPTPSNYALGLRRAQAIRQTIAASGVDPQVIEVASQGESDPAVPTPPGTFEPRNRRVEVTIR
jgi:peptidoglycan-associated lipoprotein